MNFMFEKRKPSDALIHQFKDSVFTPRRMKIESKDEDSCL